MIQRREYPQEQQTAWSLARRVMRPGGAVALLAALVVVASIGGARIAAQEPEPLLVPSPCDFATSGGFVISDALKKASFGAHGGCKHGEFWGHVNFVDHATGLHVNSIEITGYVQPGDDPSARDICGIATTNRSPDPVYFRVRLIDKGEPGTADKFGIRLSDGYVVLTRNLSSGKGGGNVQLHDPNASTTPPGEMSADEMCHGVEPPVPPDITDDGGGGGGGGSD